MMDHITEHQSMLAPSLRERGGVQSVARALTLLEIIADLGGEAALTQIAAKAGLNVSTCHHLLSTLVAKGYVARVPDRRSYALGARLIYLSHVCLRHVDLPRRAQPFVVFLQEEADAASREQHARVKRDAQLVMDRDQISARVRQERRRLGIREDAILAQGLDGRDDVRIHAGTLSLGVGRLGEFYAGVRLFWERSGGVSRNAERGASSWSSSPCLQKILSAWSRSDRLADSCGYRTGIVPATRARISSPTSNSDCRISWSP